MNILLEGHDTKVNSVCPLLYLYLEESSQNEYLEF